MSVLIVLPCNSYSTNKYTIMKNIFYFCCWLHVFNWIFRKIKQIQVLTLLLHPLQNHLETLQGKNGQ